MKFDVPTCDNVRSPTLKAVVHAATAALHLAILVYHLRNAFYHAGHRAE